jgi:hypothetical protein
MFSDSKTYERGTAVGQIAPMIGNADVAATVRLRKTKQFIKVHL